MGRRHRGGTLPTAYKDDEVNSWNDYVSKRNKGYNKWNDEFGYWGDEVSNCNNQSNDWNVVRQFMGRLGQ